MLADSLCDCGRADKRALSVLIEAMGGIKIEFSGAGLLIESGLIIEFPDWRFVFEGEFRLTISLEPWPPRLE